MSKVSTLKPLFQRKCASIVTSYLPRHIENPCTRITAGECRVRLCVLVLLLPQEGLLLGAKEPRIVTPSEVTNLGREGEEGGAAIEHTSRKRVQL
jgi:hypothetical protein